MQLKKEEGLLCVACGKPMTNVKMARKHVQTKAHQHKQKVQTSVVHICTMYIYVVHVLHAVYMYTLNNVYTSFANVFIVFLMKAQKY